MKKRSYTKILNKISNLKIYQKLIIAFCFAIIIPALVEKFAFPEEPFSVLRFSLYFIIIFVSLLPFCIFKFHTALDFLFRKRYWIGAVLFVVLVASGLHGSSMNLYNTYIQPEIPVESSEPITGVTRTIRSDEWAVNTPTLLAQIPNNLEIESEILNGYSKDVSFFPRTVTRSTMVLAAPLQLGFLCLPTEQAFAFSWWLPFFIFFFASLEFFMVITKKNRFISTLGAIMVTFAPAVQWWDNWNILPVAYGELLIVLFDKFLKNKKIYQQILLALSIGLVACWYIMILYPAWQISFGYLFALLAIWTIVENRKNCSFKKFAILIPAVLLVIGIVIVPSFINSYEIFSLTTNTVYPGHRLSTGGNHAAYAFHYLSSIFNSFKEPVNSTEMATFISLFPIPIIMGIYYWYQNRKHRKKDLLLIILTLFPIILSIWNYIPLPEWLTKITLLSVTTTHRTVVTVTYACLILLIYCLSKYSTRPKNDSTIKYQNLVIATLTTILGLVIVCNFASEKNYLSTKYIIFDLIFFIPIIYLALQNTPKSSKICLSFLALLTFISGISVHPLTQGLDVLYEKPIAKEIQKIETADPDAKWLVADPAFPTNNYTVINGADTINSTNYFPNFELWEKLGVGDQEEIYNRYAHVIIDITDDQPTSLKLLSPDSFNATINKSDLCKIDVDYILARGKNLETYNSEQISFDTLYDEDGFSISEVHCSE